MQAVSFYIVEVINAGDLNEASRILDGARKGLDEDGRILILSSRMSMHELTEDEASVEAARAMQLDANALIRWRSQPKSEVAP